MKKFLKISLIGLAVVLIAYITFIYFAVYSEGFRAGELIKISKRGLVFKTWEGRLSQGVSEEQQFNFSIRKSRKEVIDKMIDLQGKHVKLTYTERFGTFIWLGDTKYYVTAVEETDVKN